LRRLLLIDDDASALEALSLGLEDDFVLRTAASAEEGLELLASAQFDAVLCDLSLPGLSGEALLERLRQTWPGTEVVMLSGARDVEIAVRCMRAGAYDYLVKPWDVEQLRSVMARASEKAALSRENQLLRQAGQPSRGEPQLLGASRAMRDLRERIRRLAEHETDVLIQGESGTGKELVARAIHAQSRRAQGRFVAIGCGSIPADLVESELFGHEKGAFSSAHQARIGKFEYASGGTIFLDDVAALPAAAQAKLLRVLQEREVCRLGSNRMIPVDVRVLSSSNVDLQAMVRAGQFRDDLYWRLNGVPLPVPPLREREGDVELLFQAFLTERCAALLRPMPRVSSGVREALAGHSFPGNVRELKHLVETLLVLSDGDELRPEALPMQMLLKAEESLPAGDKSLREALRDFERQVITRALQGSQGNQSRAAESLGIHRNTLMVKMGELGIPSPRRGLAPEDLPQP
jgi:DNA-binding NtrC family response regulator